MNDGSWKILRQITDMVGAGGAMPAGPPQPAAPAGASDSAALQSADSALPTY
jgi:hypothetical protein